MDPFLARHNLRRAILPLLCGALIAYMGYHAFIGHRGLFTYWRLETEARELTAKLAALEAERAELEKRVELLSADSLNRDMLDERAREVLNFAEPNEIVILRD